MPRDYVHRRASSRKKGNAPSLKLWSVTLLLIGLFVVVLSYLRMTAVRGERHMHVKAHHQKPQVAEEKVRFDFYTVLPEGSTEHTAALRLKRPKISRQPVEVSEQITLQGRMQPIAQSHVKSHATFILEVAAFRHFKQADQLKAQLGLLGLEANISEIQNKGGRWSRVWMGPYESKNAAQKMQQQLQGNHIKSVVLDKNNSNL